MNPPARSTTCRQVRQLFQRHRQDSHRQRTGFPDSYPQLPAELSTLAAWRSRAAWRRRRVGMPCFWCRLTASLTDVPAFPPLPHATLFRCRQDPDAHQPTPPEAAGLRRRDRIAVRESGVHGRGVYAVAAIAKGKKIIEYKGEHISWKEALRRHPHDPDDPNHTFYFSLEDGSVIDAKYGGNRARWINHACKPNCEAREKDGRVFIHALRDIDAGEELFYDYGW